MKLCDHCGNRVETLVTVDPDLAKGELCPQCIKDIDGILGDEKGKMLKAWEQDRKVIFGEWFKGAKEEAGFNWSWVMLWACVGLVTAPITVGIFRKYAAKPRVYTSNIYASNIFPSGWSVTNVYGYSTGANNPALEAAFLALLPRPEPTYEITVWTNRSGDLVPHSYRMNGRMWTYSGTGWVETVHWVQSYSNAVLRNNSIR